MTIEEYKSNIEDVLCNCTFRDCAPIESRRQILKKIDCNRLPIRLFQYRSVSDTMIEGLKTGTIYFKSPVRFNDPYDSLMCWDTEMISEYFHNPKIADELAKHWIFDSDTLAVNIRGRFRISCFSEVSDSPLMWAHYANSGKGFCVEYELNPCVGHPMCLKDGQPCNREKDCKPSSCGFCCNFSLMPVIYTGKRPDATSALKQEIEYVVANKSGRTYDLSKHDWLEPYRTALFKSKDWAYEKEWRLLLSDIPLKGDQECLYPCGSLVRVILGSNMDPFEEYKVSKATEVYAKREMRNIELSKAYVDVQSSDYRLDIRHEWTIRGV